MFKITSKFNQKFSKMQLKCLTSLNPILTPSKFPTITFQNSSQNIFNFVIKFPQMFPISPKNVSLIFLNFCSNFGFSLNFFYFHQISCNIPSISFKIFLIVPRFFFKFSSKSSNFLFLKNELNHDKITKLAKMDTNQNSEVGFRKLVNFEHQCSPKTGHEIHIETQNFRECVNGYIVTSVQKHLTVI